MATRGHVLWGLAVLALVAMAPSASEATSVTIFFDNEGPEEGITTPGTTEFSFMGSNWTGGVIHSGAPISPFVYFVHGSASVTFDDPVDSVEFAFDHIGDPAQAFAFDAEGNLLGQSFRGLPVRFDFEAPIARILFGGGFVHNFTFTLVPEPGAGALVALGATLLAARSTRRRSGLTDGSSAVASRPLRNCSCGPTRRPPTEGPPTASSPRPMC